MQIGCTRNIRYIVNGRDAVAYQIEATAPAVVFDGQGKTEGQAFEVKAYKTVGGTRTLISGNRAGEYELRITEGGEGQVRSVNDFGSGVVSCNIPAGLSAAVFRVTLLDGSGNELARLRLPEQRAGADGKGGNDGKDAIVYALHVSNQVVAYDKDGVLKAGSTEIRLFRTDGSGTQELTGMLTDMFSATVVTDDDAGDWVDNSVGDEVNTYFFPWTYEWGGDSGNDAPQYVMLNDCKDNDRELQRVVFTAVRDGEKGEKGQKGDDAVMWDMWTDISSVQYDADGKPKAGSVTIHIVKTEGGTQTELSGATSGFRIFMGTYRGARVQPADDSGQYVFPYTYTWDADGAAPTSIVLRDLSAGKTARTLSMSKVYDGQDGQQGPPGEDGQDGAAAVVYTMRVDNPNVRLDASGYPYAGEANVSLWKTVGSVTTELVNPGNDGFHFEASLRDKSGGTTTETSDGVDWTLTWGTQYYPEWIDLINSNGETMQTVSFSTVKDGVNGLEGCVQRVTEWRAGAEYHNDSKLKTGVRYIDIVVFDDATSPTGFAAYQCLTTHTATAQTDPRVEITGTATSSANWKKIGSMQPLATPLIMAQQGLIRFMQGSQLLITDSEAQVYAGLASGDYPLWIGADVPTNANARIDKQGNAFFRNAHLDGYLFSRFRDISDEGVAHLHATGSQTYDLTDCLNVVATNKKVLLPCTAEYEGSRVLILNDSFVDTGESYYTYIFARGEMDGGISPIYGSALRGTTNGGIRKVGASAIRFTCGVVELVCVRRTVGNTAQYVWVLLNNGGSYMQWQSVRQSYQDATYMFVVDQDMTASDSASGMSSTPWQYY